MGQPSPNPKGCGLEGPSSLFTWWYLVPAALGTLFVHPRVGPPLLGGGLRHNTLTWKCTPGMLSLASGP